MKHLYKLALLFSIGALVANCERDDICSEDTPTTPRLLIEFIDIADPDREELKSVPRLTVYGDADNISIPDNEDNSGAIEIDPLDSSQGRLFNTTTSEAKPPLFVGTENEVTTIRYFFERRTDLRLDEDDETNSNVDEVEISYVSEYVYVSRACGYKSIFTTLRVTIIQDDDNWILDTEFPNNSNTDNITVEDENATHINFLH